VEAGGGTSPHRKPLWIPRAAIPAPCELTGNNFPTYISEVSITYGGVTATILSCNSTEIVFLMLM